MKYAGGINLEYFLILLTATCSPQHLHILEDNFERDPLVLINCVEYILFPITLIGINQYCKFRFVINRDKK